MKTVVLDGYPLNPGDLSWEWLSAFGEYEIYDNTKKEEIISRCKGAEFVLTNKVPFDKEIIDALPALKYIGVTGTGYNVIDTEYAAEKSITVTNVPAYSTDFVAQHTFALMLEYCNRVAIHNKAVKDGEWAVCRDFTFTKASLSGLAGKTLGIIGYGLIGQYVERIARAFGMNVLIYSRTYKPGFVDFDTLLKKADFITLHIPQTTQTIGLINEETISKMKDGVVIINTARGAVVNERDVASALASGKIAFYGADVLSSEPPKEDNLLLKEENAVLTPHIAWASFEARERLMKVLEENMTAFVSGNKINTVN